MEDAAPTSDRQSKSLLAENYLVSVDGAGVFLMCLGEKVTVGGLRNDPHRADVCLMANLQRKHLTLARANGNYHFQTHGPAVFNCSPVLPNREEPLSHSESAEWTLGDGVKIRFRLPTVLSMTAVLDFEDSHRPLVGQPPTSADQVILMDQNCLLGPGPGQHIRLDDIGDGLILFQSKNQLWCKSKTAFSRNEEAVGSSCSLRSGDLITGRDFRFRLEAVE